MFNLKKSIPIILFGISAKFYHYQKTKTPINQRSNIVFDIDETIISTIDADVYENNIGLTPTNLKLNFPNDDGEMETEYYVYQRPFSKFVLSCLCGFNNVHIFTSSKKDYADEILKVTEFDKYVMTKKYRDDCDEECKDLRVFGETVDNFILIDNDISNRCEKQNFYHIPMFSSEKCYDVEMLKLLFIVIKMHLVMDFKKLFKKENVML